MPTYKTAGIALKSLKFGEADRIVTFLTVEGKVSAIAKGIRKTTSKFGGRLEPGNDLDLVLAKGRNLDTVTQVQIKKTRVWLWADFHKLQTAFAVMESADKLTTERMHDDRMLKLLGAALDRLVVETRLSLLLSAFDIKALAISGFLPHLSSCVMCGKTFGLAGLLPAEGGLVCDQCRSGQSAVNVGDDELCLLKKLLSIRFKELDTVKADSGMIDKTLRIIWAHLCFHAHANFKTRTETGWIA